MLGLPIIRQRLGHVISPIGVLTATGQIDGEAGVSLPDTKIHELRVTKISASHTASLLRSALSLAIIKLMPLDEFQDSH